MKEDNIKTITESREKFFEFVDVCNEKYRKHNPSTYLYRKIIEKHRSSGDISKLISEDEFVDLIYMTLISWNMNQRAAEMKRYDDFKISINNLSSVLERLYKYKLHEMSGNDIKDVIEDLKEVFKGLDMMKSKSKIVGVSKTMHFLLPDLVMPIDRKYTMNFFYGNNRYKQIIDKEFKDFEKLFREFHRISKVLNLTDEDVNGKNWNTSVPKLIDNAIIGHTQEKETL